METDGSVAVVLHQQDNVAVTTHTVQAGSVLQLPAGQVQVAEQIALGHKVATAPIAAGQPVLKYGQVIGQATSAIAPGQWVHSHNLQLQDFHRDFACTSTPRRRRPRSAVAPLKVTDAATAKWARVTT